MVLCALCASLILCSGCSVLESLRTGSDTVAADVATRVSNTVDATVDNRIPQVFQFLYSLVDQIRVLLK